VVNSTSRPLYPRERDPVPIVWEAGWALEPIWTPAENLTFTGIRSPDRPARSESLYRLRYPGRLLTVHVKISYSTTVDDPEDMCDDFNVLKFIKSEIMYKNDINSNKYFNLLTSSPYIQVHISDYLFNIVFLGAQPRQLV
jgi:hypothetical protein